MKSKISKHISLREATFSITAIRKGYSNIPNKEQLENMKYVAENIFEPVREHFNSPIRVSSMFRSYKVNRAIGGSKSSQHMKGEAMDINNRDKKPSNSEIFNYIKDNLVFDQLIWEFGDKDNPAWVHVSLKECKNRNQILKAYSKNRRTYYENY